MKNRNFVISIKNAIERRNHILNTFTSKNIGFSFFDAFTPSEKLALYIEENLPNLLDCYRLSEGEKACLMSHFALWKKCVDENLDYICIFEDDIILGEQSEAFLSKDDWLYSRFNIKNNLLIHLETFFMPNRFSKKSSIPSYHNRDFIRLNSVQSGSAGYIISKQAAIATIKLLSEYKAIDLEPVDELLFNKFLKLQDWSIYQLSPAIVVQELQFNKDNSLFTSQLERERSHLKENQKKPKKNLGEVILHILTKPNRVYQKRIINKENNKKENIILFR